MNDDEIREAWHSQVPPGRVVIDVDLVLNEVKRNQRQFTTMLFWRDVREVGVALVLVPVWIVLGVTFRLPWTWYLTVPALVWYAGYMLVDRMHSPRKPPEQGESLRDCVDVSLAQVEQQIRLLASVHWWALLPMTVGMLPFVGQVAWQSRSIAAAVGVGGVVLAAMAYVYWVNQRAIRVALEPRRQELLALKRGLEDETPVTGS